MSDELKVQAYKELLFEMSKCPLLTGLYDAKNGNGIGSESFMHGILTVMEWIALRAHEEEFVDFFIDNMIASKKAKLEE